MIRNRGKSRVSVLLIVTDGELDDQTLAAKAVSAAHFCHVDNESVNVLVINTLQLTLNTYNANIYYYIHIILLYTYYILHYI